MALLLSWLLVLLEMLQIYLLCVSGRTLTGAEKKAILDAHNHYRRVVAQQHEASNIRMMVWNDELEKFADIWVSRCVFDHSPQVERTDIAGEVNAGENLWMGSPREFNYTDLVRSWYDEIKNFDQATMECSGVCGHFTQVVWSKSYKLGCGITDNSGCPSGVIFSCNYAPAGNMMNAKPFTRGTPCGGCEGDWKKFCFDGLCSNGAEKTTALMVSAIILLAAMSNQCTM